MLAGDPDMQGAPVGLVDDQVSKVGGRVHGVKVLGTCDAIPGICESGRVDQMGYVMGATKRMDEMIVQYYASISDTVFTCVRFGNVLGSHGSVIPLFKRQLKEGGPITLTRRDITRYFMTVPEASRLVITAGAFAKGGEIFVLNMGEPVRIYDLAVNLITLSGLKPGRD